MLKKDRKIIYGVLIVLLLSFLCVGCAEKPASKNVTQTKQQSQVKNNEPTQEELNVKLKQEAVKADFIELNTNPDKNKNKRVFIEGKVGVVFGEGIGQKFDISTEEGSGYGHYTIMNLSGTYDIKDNDKVKIYGTFSDKDKNTGIPMITSTIIEQMP